MRPSSSGPFEPQHVCNDSDICPDPIEKKIEGFATLPRGWNYGEGEPPGQDTIEAAVEIYKIGKKLGFSCEVFPVADGEIEVSLYRKDHFVDILIKDFGAMELTYEVGIGREFKEIEHYGSISVDGVKKQLSETAKSCNVLESLGTTIIRQKSDSPIVVSHRATGQFPLLTWTALKTSIKHSYATISRSSILATRRVTSLSGNCQ